MKTYLIIPDLHFPYHDKKYTKLITKIIKELQPHGLVSLGDFLDCFQISTYDKDPARKNTLSDDIHDWNQQLNEWARQFKKSAQIDLICGNHENRIAKYIARSCREIHDLVPDWPALLKIKERNATTKHKWTFHPYAKWNSCVIGDCTLFHGFYFNQHVAMTNLTKYRTNTISGHTHRVQKIHDGTHYAVSLGHGSDELITAHQPTPTGWTQAFALLHVDCHGKTTCDVFTVNNGRTVIYGKQY